MADIPDSYLHLVARRTGVPALWEEDCMQEMRIRLWQAGDFDRPKLVAKRAAIDFLRQITRFQHATGFVPEVWCFTDIEALSPVKGGRFDVASPVELPIDELVDVNAGIAKLEPRVQRMVIGLAWGKSMKALGERESVDESRVSQLVKMARKQLRQAVA